MNLTHFGFWSVLAFVLVGKFSAEAQFIPPVGPIIHLLDQIEKQEDEDDEQDEEPAAQDDGDDNGDMRIVRTLLNVYQIYQRTRDIIDTWDEDQSAPQNRGQSLDVVSCHFNFHPLFFYLVQTRGTSVVGSDYLQNVYVDLALPLDFPAVYNWGATRTPLNDAWGLTEDELNEDLPRVLTGNAARNCFNRYF